MQELVENFADLIQWFSYAQDKDLSKGVYVSTKIRKQVMVSSYQGKVIRKGLVRVMNFKNMGGGVWHASLKVGI